MDWHNEYEFDSRGLAKRKGSDFLTNKVRRKPSDLPKVVIPQEVVAEAQRIASPPTKAQLAQELARLRVHCVSKNLSDAEADAFLADYWHEFKDYPYSVIREGVTKWLKKSDNPLRYPTIGQFRDFIWRRAKEVEKTRRRLEVLAAQEK